MPPFDPDKPFEVVQSGIDAPRFDPEAPSLSLLPEEVEAFDKAENERQRRIVRAGIVGRLSGEREAQKGVESGGIGPGGRFGSAAQGEAFVRGVTDLFGIGDVASAGAGFAADQLTRDEDEEVFDNFAEAMAFQSARRRALQGEFPGTSLAGTAVGAIGTGAAGAARAAPKLPRALRVTQGQPIANVGRGIAGGATAGGVEAGTRAAVTGEGDVAEEAQRGGTFGALFGGVSVPISSLVRRGVETGRNLLSRATGGRVEGSIDSAARIIRNQLSKRGIDQTIDSIKRDIDDFRSIFGRTPTLQEVLDPTTASRIGNVAGRRPVLGRELRRNADEATVRRQEELSDAVGRRTTPSPDTLARRRDRLIAEQLDPVRQEPAVIDDSLREAFQDADIARNFSPRANISASRLNAARRRVLNATQDTPDPEIAVPTIDDLEALRRTAGDASLRRTIREAMENQPGEVGQITNSALRNFGRRSEQITGANTGEALLRRGTRQNPNTREAETLEDLVQRRADPRASERDIANATDSLAGARVGARGALSRRARQSPGDARNVALELDENLGLRERAPQLLRSDEAERLLRTGELSGRAVRSLEGSAPGSGALAAIEGAAPAGGIPTRIAGAATNSAAGAAFQANLIERFIDFFNIPPTASRKLAELLTNPDRVEDAIAQLRRLNIGEDDLSRVVRDAAIASGLVNERPI